MKINNFINSDDNEKVKFFIELSAKTVSLLNNAEQKTIAENAVDCCRKWLETKSPDGDFLYELLVDEQNGITILAGNTDDIREQAVWDCIIDTVAFTSRKAYEYENKKYYPEPVELVSDGLIYHFTECYRQCFPHDKTLF